MRKIVLGSLLAAALVLGGGPAVGKPHEPKVKKDAGPTVLDTDLYDCADIVTARSRFYLPSATSKPRLESYLTTAAASCPEVTYSIYVYDDDLPGATLLGSQSVAGNGATTVNFPGTFIRQEAGDTTICLVVASYEGKNLYDREPDTGCVLRDLKDGDPLEWGWIP
ncbi:MAG: hypothetical protein ACR2KK_22595 [Acidimicrobiales bacterium]